MAEPKTQEQEQIDDNELLEGYNRVESFKKQNNTEKVQFEIIEEPKDNHGQKEIRNTQDIDSVNSVSDELRSSDIYKTLDENELQDSKLQSQIIDDVENLKNSDCQTYGYYDNFENGKPPIDRISSKAHSEDRTHKTISEKIAESCLTFTLNKDIQLPTRNESKYDISADNNIDKSPDGSISGGSHSRYSIGRNASRSPSSVKTKTEADGQISVGRNAYRIGSNASKSPS